MSKDNIFEEFEDEFLKFDRVPESDRLSNRPDLHAFMLLDRLVPGNKDMVAGAQHDEIYLSPDPEELLKVATKEQLRDLHRCGVRCNYDGLQMFA